MNVTKGLAQLGFVTARGLDNGAVGALLLSNKVRIKSDKNAGYVCKLVFCPTLTLTKKT